MSEGRAISARNVLDPGSQLQMIIRSATLVESPNRKVPISCLVNDMYIHVVNECLQEDGHTEWVSCVRFSPNTQNPIIVSCGWDKLVKVFLCGRILSC